MAARYVDALRTAVAWELVYDVLMSSIMVAWPVAVGIAFYSVFSSIAAALLLAIAVVVLIIRPASPSIDSLRSIIGRILLLSATAYVGYLARSGLSGSLSRAPFSQLIGILDTGMLVVVWASVAAISAITVLMVLRLLRDEWVDRLLISCAQLNLVVELVCIAEALEKQEARVHWAPDSDVIAALRRLTEARLLVERHAWYPMGDLSVKEKQQVVNGMRTLSENILKLRSDLLQPKEGTVLELRERTTRIARSAYLGHFGEFAPGADESSISPVARLRASLGRLLSDLPLALVPFGAIWAFDQIGLDSPEYQIPRGTLLYGGVTFAIFVALRALDPSMPEKITLSGRFLSILRIWGTPSSKSEGEGDAKDEDA